MIIQTKYKLNQRVRHTLNEFEGNIIGICFRHRLIEYEVLPVTDDCANWRSPVWIAEGYLENDER